MIEKLGFISFLINIGLILVNLDIKKTLILNEK